MNPKSNETSVRQPTTPKLLRSKPGGGPAIRGFLLQAMACVFDALDPAREWTAVKFEPEAVEARSGDASILAPKLFKTADKLDIIWRKPSGEEGQQIRSRTGIITVADVERWTKEMRMAHPTATSLELILVGQTKYNPVAKPTCHGVKVTQSQIIGLGAFREVCASRLDRFLEANRVGYVAYQSKLDLVHLLAFDLLFSSQSHAYLTREELERSLLRSLRQFRSWGPNDLRRERLAREDFRAIYGVDAGPALRAAITDCYAAVEEELSPRIFRYARTSLHQDGGQLRVQIGRDVSFGYWWAWVMGSLVTLLTLLLPAIAALDHMGRGASLAQTVQNQSFGILVTVCAVFWLAALLLLTTLQRPYVCAQRIAKKLEELESLGR